ncbi:MAG: ribosome silencing factor [bacterium]
MTGSRTERRGHRKGKDPPSRRLARRLAEAAREKKAEELVILDLRDLTSVTDFFVIGTVSTDVHARAVSEHVVEWAEEELDERPWHVEGADGERPVWILMDYVDVVVHLFHPEARDYYGLERLWGDAPSEELGEPD